MPLTLTGSCCVRRGCGWRWCLLAYLTQTCSAGSSPATQGRIRRSSQRSSRIPLRCEGSVVLCSVQLCMVRFVHSGVWCVFCAVLCSVWCVLYAVYHALCYVVYGALCCAVYFARCVVYSVVWCMVLCVVQCIVHFVVLRSVICSTAYLV